MGLIFRARRNTRNSSDNVNTITIGASEQQQQNIILDIHEKLGEIKANTSLSSYRLDQVEKRVDHLEKRICKNQKK